MFDGFRLDQVRLGDVTLRVRYGGAGTPVVLLHGHPRTHTTWHGVASRLAEHHRVVTPDLRGYGGSTLPPDEPDHAQSSKRAMAHDVVRLMARLGHEWFAVAGHDRGALVAFRTAMDHPATVSHLVVMDGLPVIEQLSGRRVACPTLLLESAHDDLDIHGNPTGIWSPWIAGSLSHRVIDSGHHQAEEAPDAVARELLEFLAPGR